MQLIDSCIGTLIHLCVANELKVLCRDSNAVESALDYSCFHFQVMLVPLRYGIESTL